MSIIQHYQGPLYRSDKILDYCPQLGATLAGALSGARMDASNTVIGATSALEKVLQKIVGAQFPEVTWRKFFSEASDRSPGVETVSWREEKAGGKYAPYAAGAALPQPSKGGKKRTINSVPHAMAMGWSHDELVRAAFLGQDLKARDGITVRQAYEERVDECAWWGDPAVEITGLLTDVAKLGAVKLTKNLTPTAGGAGTAGGIADATALKIDGTDSSTAAEILTALFKFVALVGIKSSEVYKESGKLAVAPAAFRHLSLTDLSLNPTETIAQSFTKKTGIQIVECQKMANVPAAISGLAASQNFLALIPDSPMACEVIIPSPLEIFAAQQVGLEIIVPTYAEIAGLAIYEPKRFVVGYY